MPIKTHARYLFGHEFTKAANGVRYHRYLRHLVPDSGSLFSLTEEPNRRLVYLSIYLASQRVVGPSWPPVGPVKHTILHCQ